MAVSSVGTCVRRIELDSGEVEREDRIAGDAAICIFVNGEFLRTLLASPVMVKELVVGHLVCEGIVGSWEEVVGVEVSPLRVDVELAGEVDLARLTMGRADLITTACGTAASPAELRGLGLGAASVGGSLGAERLWELARELNQLSVVHRETGGTHGALLVPLEGGEGFFAEDVGRHNAVDKVVGAGVMEGVDFTGWVLVSTGRLSGEVVLKAARVGVPVVASVAGPLESGVRVAKAAGITLVGFIRGRRMNVYAHDQRVTV